MQYAIEHKETRRTDAAAKMQITVSMTLDQGADPEIVRKTVLSLLHQDPDIKRWWTITPADDSPTLICCHTMPTHRPDVIDSHIAYLKETADRIERWARLIINVTSLVNQADRNVAWQTGRVLDDVQGRLARLEDQAQRNNIPFSDPPPAAEDMLARIINLEDQIFNAPGGHTQWHWNKRVDERLSFLEDEYDNATRVDTKHMASRITYLEEIMLDSNGKPTVPSYIQGALDADHALNQERINDLYHMLYAASTAQADLRTQVEALQRILFEVTHDLRDTVERANRMDMEIAQLCQEISKPEAKMTKLQNAA